MLLKWGENWIFSFNILEIRFLWIYNNLFIFLMKSCFILFFNILHKDVLISLDACIVPWELIYLIINFVFFFNIFLIIKYIGICFKRFNRFFFAHKIFQFFMIKIYLWNICLLINNCEKHVISKSTCNIKKQLLC